MQEIEREVRWERLLPDEFFAQQKALPVVFLPLGTVEWHGLHNALGLDALKAHRLCEIAARKAGGGVVHPPVYGGMGALDKPGTVVIEGEMTWENLLLRPWLEKLCMEFHRQGFRAVIILTGHYGHNQQIVVREVAYRMTRRLGIPVLGSPEYWFTMDRGYGGDHAGISETSLMMHLQPELVRMDRIRRDPDYGSDGHIEQGSSVELGATLTGLITDRLAALARAMVGWTAQQIEAFARAEQAITDIQVKGWRDIGPWAAWEKIARNSWPYYAPLLLEGRFDELAEKAKELL